MTYPTNPPTAPQVINGDVRNDIISMSAANDFVCVLFRSGELFVVTQDGMAKRVNFEKS